MKPVFPIKTILILLLSILVFNSCQKKASFSETEFREIKGGFETPTDDNNLWCYWHWVDDDISKEGITKDLEAMKKAGIGGALIGNINPEEIDGKVPIMSEDWWSHMVHAVTEGKRIGVDIGIFNCPGWSQSGGPWVDYTKAMRYLNYSETEVKGNQTIKMELVKPDAKFQDVRTLAFKSQDAENRNLTTIPTKLTSSLKGVALNGLIDGDFNTGIRFASDAPLTINFSLSDTITARQFAMHPNGVTRCNCELFAEINGKEKRIKKFVYDRLLIRESLGPIHYGALVFSLPDVKSNKFKLVCRDFKVRSGTTYGFGEIHISETPVLNNYIEKQMGKMPTTPHPPWNTFVWETQAKLSSKELLIDVDAVHDISDKLDENGFLTWDAPEGNWTIMRIGMSPTGTRNGPAAPQGKGFEIDKMDSDLAKFHFDNFVGEFLKRIPEDSKSAFKYVIADSYETGSQNWTDDYEIKFKEKYGYDPIKYLPVLSGRIVGSVEESDRFLWDLRRSVADDVAYEYVGGLKKASNEHNLQTWLEGYGHWGFPSEFMMYGGQSDLISGEFWNEGNLGKIECKASSSTAHTYGKRRTSAEAFTAGRSSFLRYPSLLKKRGDWSLTEGINHFVLHVYVHQPDDNRKPGMNAWYGTEFNRHNTWFGQVDTYFDYLRRCQYLLQQGMYVADVCYFIGESAPIVTGARNPEIPKGYSYDYINAEVILDRLSVKDGKFVLPDGMSYSVMVLPPVNSMRPEVLAKLEQLVEQGGVILGQKPEKSPSLQNYPECDKQVQEMAAKLWASNYVEGQLSNKYGEGLVLDGQELSEVFSILNLKKDVDVPEETPILWTHRTQPGMDIYFISNQSDDEIEINPVFRVGKDLKPQLWDAVTGEIRQLNKFSRTENGTIVPIKLKAEQSWFVVFTDVNSEGIKAGYQKNFSEPEVIQTINQSFKVDFRNKEIGPKKPVVMDKLTDWSKSADEQIKYYSGTAVYTTTFDVDALAENSEVFINLGEVSVMAKVKLNGKEIGGVWIAPYRLNVSNAIKKGENELEIEVVNLWRNRIIKDKMLPESERYTWMVFDDIKEGEAPHSSGLLGPVTIESRSN